MKLILKENVAGLGYKDDVVEVKDGYGRNYLIPKRYAVIASKANLKQLEEDLRQRAHKIAKLLEEAQAKAAKLEGTKLTIPAKASATGKVFGSVNAAKVADELINLGHEIDRKLVVMEPIKEIGIYKASVKLHKEVAVEVEVEVIAEEEKA